MPIIVPGLTHSAILDASPIPTSVIDAEGTVVYVNDAFLPHASAVQGKEIRQEDRVGRNVREFMTGRDKHSQQEWMEMYDRVLKKGETIFLPEFPGRPVLDRETYMDVRMKPIRGEDGAVIAAVVTWQDVTDRVKRQREEERRTALDRVRVSMYEMRQITDIQSVLVSLYAALKDLRVDFDDCSVQIVDEEEKCFRSYSLAPDQVIPAAVIPLMDSAVYEAFRDRKPVCRRDLDEEDRYGERTRIREAGDFHIRSVLDVPFSRGTIAINSAQPEAFSEEDIEILQQLAGVLSEAYTRFEDIRRIEESEKRLQDERDEARRYLHIAGVMFVTLSADGTVSLVNEKGCDILGCKEEEIIGKNWFDRFLPERIREEVRSVFGKLMAGEIEPVEYYENPVLTRSDEERIIAWHNAILRDEAGNIIGTLSSGEDITERKRAEQALNQAVRRLNLLVDIGISIASTLDPDALLNRLIRRLVQVIPAGDLGAIYLYDPQAQVLIPEACIGFNSEAFRRIRLQPGESISGKAFQTGRSSLTRTREEGDARRGQLRPENARLFSLARGKLDIQSNICAPLRTPTGEVIGTLTVGSTHMSFREEDLFLLEGVAGEAAVAIQNAQLFSAVREQTDQLRMLSVRLSELEESERRRLAQELHDRVGQNLTALGLNLNIVRGQLSAESGEKTVDRLDDSLGLVEETMERVRDVMADLRPSVLDDYGLLAALRWYGERFSGRTGVDTVVEGKELMPRLSSDAETGLFRIVQEALTNVAKHAQTSRVTVTVDTVDGGVRVSVADDGAGFDPTTLSRSEELSKWGLVTMRERAVAMGAQLHVESEPGKGTRVVVEWHGSKQNKASPSLQVMRYGVI